MEALYGNVLDRAVHPLNLATHPRVVGLREPVFDPVCATDHVKAHGAGVDGVPVTGLFGELNAIIGENGMDPVGHDRHQVLQELPHRFSVGLIDELRDCKFTGSVDAHEQIKLSLCRLHLGDVDAEEPNGVRLNFCRVGLPPPLNIWQARDAMPLQTAMQCGPR